MSTPHPIACRNLFWTTKDSSNEGNKFEDIMESTTTANFRKGKENSTSEIDVGMYTRTTSILVTSDAGHKEARDGIQCSNEGNDNENNKMAMYGSMISAGTHNRRSAPTTRRAASTREDKTGQTQSNSNSNSNSVVDSDDDSVQDVLRTLISEDDLHKEVMGNENKRRKKIVTRDRIQTRNRRTLTSRMEHYLMEDETIYGGLADLYVVMREMDRSKRKRGKRNSANIEYREDDEDAVAVGRPDIDDVVQEMDDDSSSHNSQSDAHHQPTSSIQQEGSTAENSAILEEENDIMNALVAEVPRGKRGKARRTFNTFSVQIVVNGEYMGRSSALLPSQDSGITVKVERSVNATSKRGNNKRENKASPKKKIVANGTPQQQSKSKKRTGSPHTASSRSNKKAKSAASPRVGAKSSPKGTPGEKNKTSARNETEAMPLSRDIYFEEVDDMGSTPHSILDWRRRAQWTCSKEGEQGDHGLFSSANGPVDAGYMMTWETINPAPYVPNQPSSLDTPRRRHKDSTYAKWCSQLVHCLSTSGRNMAQHEWFYSDIDRAWYDHNEFAKDMERIGIPRDAKLTRTEWSLVRKHIRGNGRKPRRFSKKYIQSQLSKLEAYRDHVRNVQSWSHVKDLPCWGYDVPAAIPVGATVTAFNKTARLLHRGLVLGKETGKGFCRYRVQFERKELGWEFCSDTEVASHGPPQIILPAYEKTLDGTTLNVDTLPGKFPYGTAYGPLIDFHRDSNNAVITKLEENVQVHHGASGKTNTSINIAARRRQIAEEQIERETLVKLMNIFDHLTIRKEALLCAINLFHEKSSNGIDSKDPGSGLTGIVQSNKEHYDWLLSNLAETNCSIDAALAHLQVMYGASYSKKLTPPEKEAQSQKSESRSSASAIDSFKIDWVNCVTKHVSQVADNLVTSSEKVGRGICNGEGGHTTEHDLRAEVTSGWLGSAANLMLTTNLCAYLAREDVGEKERESEERAQGIDSDTLREILSTSLIRLQPNAWLTDDSLASNGGVIVNDAFNELKEAVSLLHDEISLLSPVLDASA